MSDDWQLIVRDSTLDRVGEISDFAKLEMVLRFNLADTWVLDLPTDTQSAAALTEPGAGLIVKRDGVTIMSGPVITPQRQWNASGDKLTVAGFSDDIYLEDRLVRPCAPPYTATDYDVRTGAAETVIRAYVDANAGPGAAVERQVPGLTLAADGAHGSTVTGRGRWDVLGDLLRSLATAGGDLGFRVVQSGATLVFEVYVPTDLSDSVIFSPELGNLRGFSYAPTAPEADWIVAAGSGEGAARVIRESGDNDAIVRWNRRIEAFRDRRDTSDLGELDQSIDEELANKAEKTVLTITPVDTEAVAYLADYTLGDKVSVEIDGARFSDVVREVHLTLDKDGEVNTPTIGTPGTTTKDFLGLISSIRSLKKKVTNLERR